MGKEDLLRDLQQGSAGTGRACLVEPATRFVAVESATSAAGNVRGWPEFGGLEAGYRDGSASPGAVAAAALENARSLGVRYGAFLHILEEEALQSAAASEWRFADGTPRGPLDGVPVAIKDVIDVAGCPTTGGSRIFAERIAIEDAACVASLKAAGAVLLGKTAMHEWAYGITSDNPFFGLVRNPADPERIVGGSSGGSAAAVAAGIVPVALGSDTGGSIRIPASCCGLVGFKPSYDLISREGGVPQAWSLDHIGPLAHSVSDVWAATLAAAGLGGGNSGGRSLNVPELSLEGCTLGVLAEWEDYVSQSAGGRHARRLERLQTAGASLRPFRLPDARSARAAWLTIIVAESAAYHAEHLRLSPDAISPDVRLFLEAGAEISAQAYLRAQQFRRAWVREVAQEMEDLDAFVTPTLPDVAPPIGTEMLSLLCGDVPLRDAFVHYQWPANLLGAPSISLPGDPPDGELPLGLMLTGHPGRDGEFIRLALAAEAAFLREQ